MVSDIIQMLERVFGKFTATSGKEHSYLGMNILLHEDVKLVLDMIDHIKKYLELQ